jgi:hypothetical protein
MMGGLAAQVAQLVEASWAGGRWAGKGGRQARALRRGGPLAAHPA